MKEEDETKTTCQIDVPSTPELTPRWMPQSYGTGSASSTQTIGTRNMMGTGWYCMGWEGENSMLGTTTIDIGTTTIDIGR